MENLPDTALEKWGFPLLELYRLALTFYKQNAGKALHLSYEENLKLVALKQQATFGPFDAKQAPALGVLDIIGRDRRNHWQKLGDISQDQAMEGFIGLLDTMCTAFHPYVEAVKRSRDEALKAELRRMEEEKLERERKEREQSELLSSEGYKEELQRRQLQDELNKQTYQQFKSYAEKQFPGNPEQQAVLIHQLQQEHYHQYMQQLHMQNENISSSGANNTNEAGVDAAGVSQESSSMELAKIIDQCDETCCRGGDDNDVGHPSDAFTDDYVLVRPPKMWTRPDIEAFKAEVSAGDGDGVLTVGHGDTVTVRVPTNANGKCLFWEFATDNYDIGFGIYFEWSKATTSEVTVHVSDSDDEDDLLDDDNVSTVDDLECGGGVGTGNTESALGKDHSSTSSYLKPPISIIIPIYRRECFNEVYVGSHSFPGEGVYLLKFDNSYSIWRSKTLYYRVYYER